MKRIEQREEVRKVSEVAELTCDLCGAVAPSPNERVLGNWEGEAPRQYEEDNPWKIRVTVEMKEMWTSQWPEGGGDSKHTEVDLCPSCFGKLIEWLKQQGATPRVTESDW